MTKLPSKTSASWQSIVLRFQSGIEVQANGCWVCRNASREPNGYRRLVSNRRPVGFLRISTHRLSYMLHVGDIPNGYMICHWCDNRECCNPEHLFLGSPADNARDMAMKRRGRQGEQHPHARITRQAAEQIRTRCASGERQSDVGREYGISQAAVSKIVRGQAWVGPDGELPPPTASRLKKPCSVDGCPSLARKNGMCLKHQGRLARLGSVEAPPKSSVSLSKLIAEKMLAGIIETDSGCWECATARYSHGSGYGRIMVEREYGSLRDYVHRVSYQHFKGQIPRGFVIRHSCDNRRCCNPDHLTLGTQSDNMTDMVARGRSRTGERHHNAILTSGDVKTIRSLAGTIPQWRIGRMFNVTQPTVSDIVRRKKWSHL